MTDISPDHMEWAVVDRLRSMLENPPNTGFNVTQTYALFTTILCWAVQRLRIRPHEISGENDRIAHRLLKRLSNGRIADLPWEIDVASVARIKKTDEYGIIHVPAAVNFEMHKVDRFLVNLRDATAHGDSRNIFPFNVEVGDKHLLAGFTFVCSEFENRKKTWEGKITLLERDMRQIGLELANIYCNALRRSGSHRDNSHFENDARSIKELAA